MLKFWSKEIYLFKFLVNFNKWRIMKCLLPAELFTIIAGRGFLNPLHIFYLTILSTLPHPPPFQMLSNLPPFLVASHFNAFALFVVLFLLVDWWLCHILCANLLNGILGLHILSLNSLLPEGPCCVFYATRRQGYWGMTHNVAFCWYSVLISHAQKYTHKDKQHNHGPID